MRARIGITLAITSLGLVFVVLIIVLVAVVTAAVACLAMLLPLSQSFAAMLQLLSCLHTQTMKA